jgi:hypothetical protein
MHFSGLETSNPANQRVNPIHATDDSIAVLVATRESEPSDADWVVNRFTN